MEKVEIDNNFYSVWNDAASAIRLTNNKYYIYPLPPPRAWHRDLQSAFKLHPVVENIVRQGVRPVDWHQLLLEWPHVSEDDKMMLAYTRDDRKGETNVQTKTSVGKYLSRHWPHVPDNIRRDWASLHTPDRFEIWATKEEIIRGIEIGPVSCMRSSQGNVPFGSNAHSKMLAYFKGDNTVSVPWNDHPYACYAPEYGWRMAVRIDPGKPDIVMGRALVLDLGANPKCFVRSYKRHADGDNGYSYSDEALEAWLFKQGYEKHGAWPDGALMAAIEHPHHSGYMAPYLDGEVQTVDISSCCGKDVLVIQENGPHACDNTDGMMGEDNGRGEHIGTCDCCGCDVYEEDDGRLWAGYHEEDPICPGCADEYTYVTGESRRGGTVSYYVHSDNAVTVDCEYYDEDNLPDYIVQLHDGDYAHRDNTVYLEDSGEYYLHYDEDIVYCEDDEYRLRENCWRCASSGEWYSDSVDCVEVDGETYHPDNAPEIEEIEENEANTGE